MIPDFQNVLVSKAADGNSLASSMEASVVLLEKNTASRTMRPG